MITQNARHFLVPGREYLAQTPNFKLVGRDQELEKLSGILMRKDASNALVVGAGGVGCSALCLGLQAKKENPDAPFDIVGKRIYWLDTDGLFASGDYEAINTSFQKLMQTLARTANRDTVLVIEDMRVFIDAARSNNCSHFMNSLMRELRRGRFQAVLETRDQDLDIVLKSHSDMYEIFTMVDVQEPKDEPLHEIVAHASKELQEHHQINIGEEAIAAAIDLTTKYRVRDMSLSRAQPERAINLIDRSLVAYRQEAHSCPPAIRQKQQQLDQILERQAGERADEVNEAGLIALKSELESALADMKRAWETDQKQLRHYANQQRQGEELLLELQDELATRKDYEKSLRDEAEQSPDDASGSSNKPMFQDLSAQMAEAGFGSSEVQELQQKIAVAEELVAENGGNFAELTARINGELRLEAQHVLSQFSKISGISTDKLSENEREKLLSLDRLLKEQVYGQDHAVDAVANAVRVARAGLQDPNKPESAFLFLGPSGVGKTEIAKALARILKGDEKALFRLDMSEYMEKHSVAKLIGAPPGYDGFEQGGILTNAMRLNPHRIILFDEIEKAHPDVFNVLLQILDDGRLTDNRGLTVQFGHANIIMTTNLGQGPLLDISLSFDEASVIAKESLDDTYRPEFLNRFNGRENIIAFNRLDLDVVQQIARREIGKLNGRIAEQVKIQISMSDETLRTICQSQYNPTIGARGIPGFFNAKIYPAIARQILGEDQPEGVMEVHYDRESQSIAVDEPAPKPDLVTAQSGTG